MPPKSIPPDPVSATGAPSIALGIKKLESFHARPLEELRAEKERAAMIPPVRPIAIEDIEAARERITGTVLRTPLVQFDERIWLKLENLQPTNAYKIRGGANAVANLSDEARARGVWTISAGNAGQGVAYAARAFGIPCTVVAIETAPHTKLDRMRALGAEIVPVSYDRAWVAAE